MALAVRAHTLYLSACKSSVSRSNCNQTPLMTMLIIMFVRSSCAVGGRDDAPLGAAYIGARASCPATGAVLSTMQITSGRGKLQRVPQARPKAHERRRQPHILMRTSTYSQPRAHIPHMRSFTCAHLQRTGKPVGEAHPHAHILMPTALCAYPQALIQMHSTSARGEVDGVMRPSACAHPNAQILICISSSAQPHMPRSSGAQSYAHPLKHTSSCTKPQRPGCRQRGTLIRTRRSLCAHPFFYNFKRSTACE